MNANTRGALSKFPRRVLLLLLLTLSVFNSGAASLLLSHYMFDGDGRDALNISPPMDLFSGASFPNGTLYLPEFYVGASAQIPSLVYNSFTVAIDFEPLSVDPQWHHTILSGGIGSRWIGVHTDGQGQFYIALNNWNWVHSFTNVITVNSWHTLVCSVDIEAQRIITFLDGQQLPTWNFGGRYDFNVGPNEGSEKVFSFRCWGDGSQFFGYADNLRVYRRALTAAEIIEPPSARVSIQRFDQSVIVHWPTNLDGYALEFTPSLSAPVWKVDDRAPAMVGDQKVVIDLLGSEDRFYRLKRL